jgi:hypothetical protein
MATDREQDLETFRIWMSQLNHEDYLLVSRVAIGMISQPVFVLGYIFAEYHQVPVVPEILVWSNLVISVIIYASILAAFRVYLETRVKIRPLVQKHPDFPMRRLPNIRPGLGLYCPVGLGLMMVVIWSSFLYVEAAADPVKQRVAVIIAIVLSLVGIAFAIGVGSSLSEDAGKIADATAGAEPGDAGSRPEK